MNTQSGITFEQINQMLEHYQHRLISLEIDLQDSYKQRILPKPEYVSRMEFLKSLRAELNKLNLWESFQKPVDANHVDLGLPGFEECTLEEKHVCIAFLNQRIKVAENIYRSVFKLFRTIEPIGRSGGGFLRITFALSQIRKKLEELDTCAFELEKEQTKLDTLVEKLLGGVLQRSTRNKLSKNLNGLVEIFQELDLLASRVAKLKASVTREEELLEKMRQWNGQYEVYLDKLVPQHKPPTPLSAAQAARLNVEDFIRPIEQTKSRLTVARRYLEQCLQRSSSTSTPMNISKTKDKSSKYHESK